MVWHTATKFYMVNKLDDREIFTGKTMPIALAKIHCDTYADMQSMVANFLLLIAYAFITEGFPLELCNAIGLKSRMLWA